MRKGQVSLEYLIVLAALLMFLAFFVPVLEKLQNAGWFAAETMKAKEFGRELVSAIEETAILGEGTQRILEVKPLSKWEIEANQEGLCVSLHSAELKKSKEICFELNYAVQMKKLFPHPKKENQLLVRKEKGAISVKHL